MTEIKLGTYKHYKGRKYEVIGIGHHNETLEEMIIYKALYNSKEFGDQALWIRPKNMFMEKVTYEGQKVDRFEYIKK